ncbi:MAG: anthranilate phosphoribosyltransferase [Chitinispirillaceae bacterium]|nr:anthranilate phosphoribosyltransferase [Chitinispirillaceae bacterium]
MPSITAMIKKLVEGQNLTFDETVGAFNEIMSGEATEAQIAAFIVALRMKGEVWEEIAGAATVMRNKATKIEPKNRNFLLDTCGTGGDCADTFNISTCTALVATAAGARVAKHGNRSVSSRCGSADVLEALNVKITISPEKMGECLDKVGMAFLFAPLLHQAMKFAIKPRKEIGIRTVFNILGPLTNPASAPSQLIGVFSEKITETIANVLKNLGNKHSYIVYGMDGLDEISLCEETKVSELKSDGSISTYYIKPEDFGFRRVKREEIKGGGPAENAEIIKNILNGNKGPQRDIVCLNAGFALCASGISKTPQDGIKKAEEAIDSGRAKEILLSLIEFTQAN